VSTGAAAAGAPRRVRVSGRVVFVVTTTTMRPPGHWYQEVSYPGTNEYLVTG
jgi:hypothetical protein